MDPDDTEQLGVVRGLWCVPLLINIHRGANPGRPKGQTRNETTEYRLLDAWQVGNLNTSPCGTGAHNQKFQPQLQKFQNICGIGGRAQLFLL